MRALLLLPAMAVLAVASTGSSRAQLTPDERKAIDHALGLWNLDVSDLGFEKRLYRDRYRLPLVDTALTAPLDAASDLMKLQGVARLSGTKVAPLLQAAWRQVQPPPAPASDSQFFNNSEGLALVPAACRSQVDAAINVVDEATGLVNQAIGKLSEQERADLLRSLPALAEAPVARLAQARKGRLLSRDAVLRLLAKVDFGLMEQASMKLANGLPPIIESLRAVAGKVVIPKPIRFDAFHLPVVIGSTGDDRISGVENSLVIDLRGNDSYGGRVGTGICGCGVLIDLGGADQFDLGDFSGGAGILGCGAVYAMGGNHRVFAKSVALGAAMAGSGTYLKVGGNDVYRSLSCSQGFAIFGVGMLEDTKGDDRYQATDFAQGSALTKGFGWLVDRQGNDVYTIGGRVPGAPLDPGSWTCFGQGAASGFREDSGGVSGGIGVLSDLQGDDVYKGGMYCQGASYWFALGALMDDGGNDAYIADYYAQAAAMHCCGAYLMDLAGDDVYTVRKGAMQAIGHDYGVAMLLDRQGNDVYSGGDSRPGQAGANGVGIFLDSAGDDRYFGPPGVAAGARGTGSIALFVDMAGHDEYARGLADGQVSLTGMWGIAVDMPTPDTALSSGEAHPRPKAGTAPMPPAAQMERIYASATLWGVGSQQDTVRRSVDQLVAIGLPALDWMLKNKLDSADRLSLRAFDAVISATGDAGKALVVPYADPQRGAAAENAWRLAVTHRIGGVESFLPAALLDAKLRDTAIRAAGAIKAQAAIPALVGFAEGSAPALSLAALLALDQIGSEDAVYTFVKMSTSPELPVRKTALRALAKWPARAMEAAKVLLQGSGRPLRVGIELLGAIGNDEALKAVVEQLKSKDAGARLEAVRVLHERNAALYAPMIEPLKADRDPDVRALAAWAVRQ